MLAMPNRLPFLPHDLGIVALLELVISTGASRLHRDAQRRNPAFFAERSRYPTLLETPGSQKYCLRYRIMTALGPWMAPRHTSRRQYAAPQPSMPHNGGIRVFAARGKVLALRSYKDVKQRRDCPLIDRE